MTRQTMSERLMRPSNAGRIDPGALRGGRMPRAVPCGLLGMICVVAAVELMVEHHHLDFTRFYIHDWRVNGRAARESAPGCRVLCFGDSLVKFGLAPRALERRLGGRAYNLAVCDGQAASTFYLLRRALAAGARPDAIVVDFVPHLLASDPRHNLRQWPELVELPELLDLGVSTRHAGFFAALALGTLLPSVKDRHEIRTYVAAAVAGRSASRRHEIPAYVDRWTRDAGAQLCAERPSYDGAIDAKNRGYFPPRWSCHATNARFVRRILDLAETEGIRVYWLLPPVVPRFQERWDELGLEASYTRFLATMTDRYRNLTVIDGRHAGYGHSLFIDPLHLNERGAMRLTNDVAAVMERSRAVPRERWAGLSRTGAVTRQGNPTVALEVTRQGRRP